MLPGSLALLVHQNPDPRRRARALGVWGGMGSLGVALGSLLGQGHLGPGQALSLRVPLLVATAGYLVAIALAWTTLRDR